MEYSPLVRGNRVQPGMTSAPGTFFETRILESTDLSSMSVLYPLALVLFMASICCVMSAMLWKLAPSFSEIASRHKGRLKSSYSSSIKPHNPKTLLLPTSGERKGSRRGSEHNYPVTYQSTRTSNSSVSVAQGIIRSESTGHLTTRKGEDCCHAVLKLNCDTRTRTSSSGNLISKTRLTARRQSESSLIEAFNQPRVNHNRSNNFHSPGGVSNDVSATTPIDHKRMDDFKTFARRTKIACKLYLVHETLTSFALTFSTLTLIMTLWSSKDFSEARISRVVSGQSLGNLTAHYSAISVDEGPPFLESFRPKVGFLLARQMRKACDSYVQSLHEMMWKRVSNDVIYQPAGRRGLEIPNGKLISLSISRGKKLVEYKFKAYRAKLIKYIFKEKMNNLLQFYNRRGFEILRLLKQTLYNNWLEFIFISQHVDSPTPQKFGRYYNGFMKFGGNGSRDFTGDTFLRHDGMKAFVVLEFLRLERFIEEVHFSRHLIKARFSIERHLNLSFLKEKMITFSFSMIFFFFLNYERTFV